MASEVEREPRERSGCVQRRGVSDYGRAGSKGVGWSDVGTAETSLRTAQSPPNAMYGTFTTGGGGGPAGAPCRAEQGQLAAVRAGFGAAVMPKNLFT